MEQQQFTKHLHTLRDMIASGIGYFSSWHMIANLSEDEAHALNRYRGFFIPVQISLKEMALLQFSKVFDHHRGTVSLPNLLSAAMSNPTLLVPNATMNNLEKLEKKINDNRRILDDLKTYRDQHLAHHYQVMKDVSLLYGEVSNLIDNIKDMYNLLSSWHERSTTLFDRICHEAESHTSDVKRIMYEERERARIRSSKILKKIK